MASPYSPVLISSAPAGAQAFTWAAVTYGPFSIGPDLWCFLSNNSTASGIWKSHDSGKTWTEIDASHHVTSANAVPFYDAIGNRLIVAYRIPGGGGQALRFQNFDFVSGTWGTIYGILGAPSNATQVTSVVLRPDGSLFVLYSIGPPQPIAPATSTRCAMFSGTDSSGSWVAANIDVGVNLGADAAWIQGTTIATDQVGVFCDASGVVHLTLCNISVALHAYQQVLANNTLANYHKFTDNLQVFSGVPTSAPIVFGGKLVIAVVYNDGVHNRFATVYTAPNPATPVFTLLGANGMESQFSIDNILSPCNNPRMVLSPDGSTLYAVYSAFDITARAYADIHICQTSGDPGVAANWTDNNVWMIATDSPPGFDYGPGNQEVQLAGLSTALPYKAGTPVQLLLSADANDPTPPNVEERFWFGVFVAPQPPFQIIDQTSLPCIPLPDPRTCRA